MATKKINTKTLEELLLNTKGKNNRHTIGGFIRREARYLLPISKCKLCDFTFTQVCHIKSIWSFPLNTTVAEINNLNNLIRLCPNHHYLLDNNFLAFDENGNSYIPIKIEKTIEKYYCNDCGQEKSSSLAARCYKCAAKYRHSPTKIKWPSKEELTKLVWEEPLIKLSKKLGVSDNAIRKYCRKHNIALPKNGYWTQKIHKLN